MTYVLQAGGVTISLMHEQHKHAIVYVLSIYMYVYFYGLFSDLHMSNTQFGAILECAPVHSAIRK